MSSTRNLDGRPILDWDVAGTEIERLEAGLRALPKIPRRMHNGIRRYVLGRMRPGGFLQAFLANDLYDTLRLADDENILLLSEWMTLLYHYLPSGCWGSPKKVRDWIAMRNDEEI